MFKSAAEIRRSELEKKGKLTAKPKPNKLFEDVKANSVELIAYKERS